MAQEKQMKTKDESVLSRHFTPKTILLFVLPVVITALFSSLYGIVDGLFVSNIGGSSALGAVNLASPIFMIVASFGFMFGTGGTALVSKVMGEGEPKKANQLFSLLSYSLILIGIIATVLLSFFFENILTSLGCSDNMRPLCMAYGKIIIPFIPCFMLMFFFQSFCVTAGKAKLGLFITLASGIFNIIGDAVLVGVVAPKMTNVPEASIMGAAIATAAGLVIGGVIPLVYFIFGHHSPLRLGKPTFALSNIAKTCSNGMSEFFSNVSTSIVNTVYNGILLFLVSDIGVAAYGAISYINTAFTTLFMGFTIGIAPVIGYNYGAKNHAELQNVHKNNLKIITISSVIMAIVAFLLAKPLAVVFSGSGKDARMLADFITTGMKIFAVSFLFKGINMYASGFFTSLNNGLISGILALLRTLVFSIGAVIILPLVCYYVSGEDANAGMLGVWWAVNVAETLALITSLIFLKANKKKYNY